MEKIAIANGKGKMKSYGIEIESWKIGMLTLY